MSIRFGYFSSADECGWRKFPPAGPLRVEVENAGWYAQADLAEAVMERNRPAVEAEMDRRIKRMLEFRVSEL